MNPTKNQETVLTFSFSAVFFCEVQCSMHRKAYVEKVSLGDLNKCVSAKRSGMDLCNSLLTNTLSFFYYSCYLTFKIRLWWIKVTGQIFLNIGSHWTTVPLSMCQDLLIMSALYVIQLLPCWVALQGFIPLWTMHWQGKSVKKHSSVPGHQLAPKGSKSAGPVNCYSVLPPSILWALCDRVLSVRSGLAVSWSWVPLVKCSHAVGRDLLPRFLIPRSLV